MDPKKIAALKEELHTTAVIYAEANARHVPAGPTREQVKMASFCGFLSGAGLMVAGFTDPQAKEKATPEEVRAALDLIKAELGIVPQSPNEMLSELRRDHHAKN